VCPHGYDSYCRATLRFGAVQLCPMIYASRFSLNLAATAWVTAALRAFIIKTTTTKG